MKKLLQILSLYVFIQSTQASTHSHEDIEQFNNPPYINQAKGNLNKFSKSAQKYAWPFDLLSIGHSIASYQNYGSNPYFHHGLDIRGDAGTVVQASRGGKVIAVRNYHTGGPLYWEVAILDHDGFIWQYHHIDHTTIPKEVKNAYQNKTEIAPGTTIGKIVRWPVSANGERYHHIHLNVLASNGHFVNPFLFLENLPDQKSPEVIKIGLLNRARRPVQATKIHGDYGLYVETQDLILHNEFYVPPYTISYKINNGPKTLFWKFDSIPGENDINKYVHDFYVPSGTCGNYRCRKILLDLGFSKTTKTEFPKQAGNYHIDVFVSDFAGNTHQKGFDFEVSASPLWEQ